jgi:hypothetical protein
MTTATATAQNKEDRTVRDETERRGSMAIPSIVEFVATVYRL